MCRSDQPCGVSRSGIARPTRPFSSLPDLCPTSRVATLCRLPDLPDLFALRAYIASWIIRYLYVRKQVRQVGEVGQCVGVYGVELPNLIGSRSGRASKVGQSAFDGADLSGLSGWTGVVIGSLRVRVVLIHHGRGSSWGFSIAGSTAANARKILALNFGSLERVWVNRLVQMVQHA